MTECPLGWHGPEESKLRQQPSQHDGHPSGSCLWSKKLTGRRLGYCLMDSPFLLRGMGCLFRRVYGKGSAANSWLRSDSFTEGVCFKRLPSLFRRAWQPSRPSHALHGRSRQTNSYSHSTIIINFNLTEDATPDPLLHIYSCIPHLLFILIITFFGSQRRP